MSPPASRCFTSLPGVATSTSTGRLARRFLCFPYPPPPHYQLAQYLEYLAVVLHTLEYRQYLARQFLRGREYERAGSLGPAEAGDGLH